MIFFILIWVYVKIKKISVNKNYIGLNLQYLKNFKKDLDIFVLSPVFLYLQLFFFVFFVNFYLEGYDSFFVFEFLFILFLNLFIYKFVSFFDYVKDNVYFSIFFIILSIFGFLGYNGFIPVEDIWLISCFVVLCSIAWLNIFFFIEKGNELLNDGFLILQINSFNFFRKFKINNQKLYLSNYLSFFLIYNHALIFFRIYNILNLIVNNVSFILIKFINYIYVFFLLYFNVNVKNYLKNFYLKKLYDYSKKTTVGLNLNLDLITKFNSYPVLVNSEIFGNEYLVFYKNLNNFSLLSFDNFLNLILIKNLLTNNDFNGLFNLIVYFFLNEVEE